MDSCGPAHPALSVERTLASMRPSLVPAGSSGRSAALHDLPVLPALEARLVRHLPGMASPPSDPVLVLGGREPESIVDGPGFRYVVFVQGCCFACPGCHNPAQQEYRGGRPWKVSDLLADLETNPLLDGVTLSGGEPFTQAPALATFAEGARARGLSVMTYTGFTWEELRAARRHDWERLLEATDILVDGPYLEECRNLELSFRGSSNQRLLDVQKSLAWGRAVHRER